MDYNRRRGYGYQQPPQINPNLVDFGQMMMYNPQDTERLSQIGQGMQQRYDASQATIAKYLEDINAADFSGLSPEVRDRMMLELDANAARLQEKVSKDYQGDYGRALPDILKGLSRDRGLMHQGVQESKKATQAFAEYQQALHSGKVPHFVDPITNQNRIMTFEEYHEGASPHFTDEGKFVGAQYNPLRGASDMEGYLYPNVSKALNESMTEGDMTIYNKHGVMGLLTQWTKKGFTDKEIQDLLDGKTVRGNQGVNIDPREFTNQLRNGITFLNDEYKKFEEHYANLAEENGMDRQQAIQLGKQMADRHILDRATNIIKGQVASQIGNRHMGDPSYDKKGGTSGAGLPTLPKLTQQAGVPLTTEQTGRTLQDYKRLAYGTDGGTPNEQVGDLLELAYRATKDSNKDKYQILDSKEIGKGIGKRIAENKMNEDFFKALIPGVKNAIESYELPEQLLESYIANPSRITKGALEQHYIAHLREQGISSTIQGEVGIGKIFNEVDRIKKLTEDLDKDTEKYLNETGLASYEVFKPTIESGFGKTLVDAFDIGGSFNLLNDFAPIFSGKGSSKDKDYGLVGKEIADRFKIESGGRTKYVPTKVEIMRGDTKSPLKFILYDNKGEPVMLDLIKEFKHADNIIKDIAFKSRQPVIYNDFIRYSLAQELKTSKKIEHKDANGVVSKLEYLPSKKGYNISVGDASAFYSIEELKKQETGGNTNDYLGDLIAYFLKESGRLNDINKRYLQYIISDNTSSKQEQEYAINMLNNPQ